MTTTRQCALLWTEIEDATPGPWTMHEGEDYVAVLGPMDTTDAPVANVCWSADARLIAAAPELLVALKCFLGDPRFHVAVGGNPCVVEAMLAKAYAVVAKAEGRA